MASCNTFFESWAFWIAIPGFPNAATIERLQAQPTNGEQAFWEPKKNEVRDAFKHAWSGYRSMAYPNDELLSLSGGKSNKYNGWGVTLFDSLDTMWIMGLRDEFADAVHAIRDVQFHATKRWRFHSGPRKCDQPCSF